MQCSAEDIGLDQNLDLIQVFQSKANRPMIMTKAQIPLILMTNSSLKMQQPSKILICQEQDALFVGKISTSII